MTKKSVLSERNIFKRLTNKAKRIFYSPSSLGYELEFLSRNFKPKFMLDKPCMPFGLNFDTSTELPLAMIWGVEAWRRHNISALLPDFRTVFVNRSLQKARIEAELQEFSQGSDVIFVCLNGSMPKNAITYANQNNISIYRLQNTFLQTFGFGDRQTKIHSIALDKYNEVGGTSNSVELKSILEESKFSKNAELQQKAKAGLAIFQAAKLSRNFELVKAKAFPQLEIEKQHSILVLGHPTKQYEQKFGLKTNVYNRFTNSNLIQKVAELYPDAQIFFQPHEGATGRFEKHDLAEHAKSICMVVDSKYPFQELIDQVDQICTFDSLKGLEARIQGKNVTVFGDPFYAGWGVTDDQDVETKPKGALSLEELFTGAYMTYPRYVHPDSDVLCSYFDVANYFLVEKLKFDDILNIDPEKIELALLQGIGEFLSAPVKLLLYLTTTQYLGNADVKKVLDIAQTNFKLREFSQFSHLLIHTANYDALQQFCNFAVDEFNLQWDDIKFDRSLLESFFAAFSTAQKNSSGRPLNSLKDQSAHFVELVDQHPEYQNITMKYLQCQSNNLQYDSISNFLDASEESENIQANFVQKLNAILQARPSRSERNHARRHLLLRRSSELYKNLLNDKYQSQWDMFLNIALFNIAVDDEQGVIKNYDLLISMFGKNGFSFDSSKISKWGALAKRTAHFYSIFNYLLKKGRFDYVRTMLTTHFYVDKSLQSNSQKVVMEGMWLSYYSAKSDHPSFIRQLNKSSPKTQNIPKTIVAHSKALKALGEFELAKKVLQKYLPSVSTHEKWVAVNAEIEKIDFSIQTGQILASYPQPKIPKGVIFLTSQTCYNTLAMMVPSLISLKKKGYAVVNLMQGILPMDPTGIDYLDQFSASIPNSFFLPELHNSWDVDWEKRRVTSCGTNFYQGFYERLSTTHRLYKVDLNEDAIQRDFMVQLKRSDTCLNICNRIYNSVVKRNINVAFVSGNSHVTPFSIFRDFARDKDDPRLSYINCNVAYESYFSNLGSKFAQTMCVTDMTLHPNRRAPFLALKSDFDIWYKKNSKNAAFRERAESMIKVNRNSSTSNKTEKALIEYLDKRKKAGAKIICCFGKIPVDLNVPYDGGPAHQDMADWITHTAKICGESEDVVLLVKPHPHELRPEIALDLIDSFSDLIDTDIKSNVKVLGHRDINVHALAPYLDLAVLWNGSSALELTALGIPVMMCSHFGRHDYPVDLIYPSSRKQYAKYLAAGSFRTPSKELRHKAAFLISYMGTDEISIHNDYALRQLTNDKVGIPRWQKKRIEQFLEQGDPKMDLIAKRIVAKFETGN